MDIQEYKAISFKYNGGYPIKPPEMYMHTVIKTLNNDYDMKRSMQNAAIWNESFKECMHHLECNGFLPISKKSIQFFFDDEMGGGFCGVVITEKYKCGFYVSYFTNVAQLSYGSEDDTKFEIFKHFDELCARANDLIDSEFNIFMEMANSYRTIRGSLILFNEHIISAKPAPGILDILCDNQVIYSRTAFSEKSELENWKV